MDYQEAIAKLGVHASVSTAEAGAAAAGFTFAVRRYKKYGETADFKSLAQDVLKCLEAINEQLNGTIRTQSTKPPAAAIDFQLVYAVNSILQSGWDFFVDATLRKDEGDAVLDPIAFYWTISTAWTAILDGDIRPLRQFLNDTAVAAEVDIDMSLFDYNIDALHSNQQ